MIHTYETNFRKTNSSKVQPLLASILPPSCLPPAYLLPLGTSCLRAAVEMAGLHGCTRRCVGAVLVEETDIRVGGGGVVLSLLWGGLRVAGAGETTSHRKSQGAGGDAGLPHRQAARRPRLLRPPKVLPPINKRQLNMWKPDCWPVAPGLATGGVLQRLSRLRRGAAGTGCPDAPLGFSSISRGWMETRAEAAGSKRRRSTGCHGARLKSKRQAGATDVSSTSTNTAARRRVAGLGLERRPAPRPG